MSLYGLCRRRVVKLDCIIIKMKSWSYVCGGKGFVSDDTASATGEIARSSKNGPLDSELKSPWSYGSTMICPRHEGVENQDFVDLGSSDMMRKSLTSESVGDVLAGKISCGREISLITAPRNAFSGEDESTSKLSSSVVESNCRESSLIDLKLGRLNDHREGKNFSSSKATPKLSSAESSIPAKRARAGGLTPQTAYCQVHGCRKDLSSSKDYHKRHKVCEVHSKTSKVIVNGIEQRFCQQCSRFHLLDEFDDGKRSCRKRLAGHNERRRKPQMRMPTGRVGRLFQPFNATCFQGNAFSASSFVCQDTLPSSHLPLQKYEINGSSGLLKLEDGADLNSHLAIPSTNDAVMPPKSLFALHDYEKQCTTLLNDGISASARNKINGNSSYLQGIADSDFVSRSVYHNSSVGDTDMTVLDSSSTIQELSDMSNSGCALSLLSSQSQSSSNHSSGIPTAVSQSNSGIRALYAITQQPEKLLGLNSQTPASVMSTIFHSSLMSSMEENHMDPIVISAGGTTVGSGIDRIIQGSANVNSKNQFSSTDGSTINLLQLSSQLERVERQRESLLMKQEDDAYSGLRIT